MLDLAMHPTDPNSVLAASTDRTITLLDLRASASTVTSANTPTFMHPATPSCVRSSPNSAYHVASGAYDGMVRIWDLRCVRGGPGSGAGAVVSFKAWDGKTKKVLSVDWIEGVLVIGGEGGLEVWRWTSG
jgi:ribosome biogenesis protein